MGRPRSRYKVKDGYYRICVPEHYNSQKDNRVLEHKYFYETYHKCCLLDWGVIHHIDGNKHNNMIWNLEGMMRRIHSRTHNIGKTHRLDKHKDTSDRKCFRCGSNKTLIHQPVGNIKTPYPLWCHLPWDKENWYCHSCYGKEMRKHFKA